MAEARSRRLTARPLRGLWKHLRGRFLHPLEIPALLSPILFDLDANEKAFSCVDFMLQATILYYKIQACITRRAKALGVPAVLFDAGSRDALDEEPLAEQEDKEYGEQGHDGHREE